MSIESEKNFINELKFDVLKDKVKVFFLDNVVKIVVILIILSIIVFSAVFINFYKENKLEKYNNKIYEALVSNNKILDLEKVYKDDSIPRVSKTIAGFNLVDLYTDYTQKEIVLKEIYENERDIFFRYYAALAIFTIEINKDSIDTDYLDSLIEFLEQDKNPLINLFLEQKALYLMKINKQEEANKILNNLLNSNEDEDFKARIRMYL